MSEIYPEDEYNPEELVDDQSTLWLDRQFVEHVRFVLNKLPQSDRKKLRDRNPMIFAPEPDLGKAMVVPRSMEAGEGSGWPTTHPMRDEGALSPLPM